MNEPKSSANSPRLFSMYGLPEDVVEDEVWWKLRSDRQAEELVTLMDGCKCWVRQRRSEKERRGRRRELILLAAIVAHTGLLSTFTVFLFLSVYLFFFLVCVRQYQPFPPISCSPLPTALIYYTVPCSGWEVARVTQATAHWEHCSKFIIRLRELMERWVCGWKSSGH